MAGRPTRTGLSPPGDIDAAVAEGEGGEGHSRVGFVVRRGRRAAVDAADRIRGQLAEAGVDDRCCRRWHGLAQRPRRRPGRLGRGDGTSCGAPRRRRTWLPGPGNHGRPGSGSSTEVEPAEAMPLIRSVLGRGRIEERMALTVEPVTGAGSRPMGPERGHGRGAPATGRAPGGEVDGAYVTTFSATGSSSHPRPAPRLLLLRARTDRQPVVDSSCSRRSLRTWSSIARSS